MNKEEKEAIERLDFFNKTGYATFMIKYGLDRTAANATIERTIKTVLNLIQKQEAIIDKMAEYMKEKDIDEDICTRNVINPQLCNEEYSNCKECIKEYFKKEVEKGEQS